MILHNMQTYIMYEVARVDTPKFCKQANLYYLNLHNNNTKNSKDR